MATLHTFHQGLSHLDALASCIKYMQADDCLLLIEDAVTIPARHSLLSEVSDQLFYMQADCQLRGVKPVTDEQQLISYGQFVELTIQYDKMVAW